MKTIKEALIEAAEKLRGDKPPAPADPFNPGEFPFAVQPGHNRIGFKVCPRCGKPPTMTGNPRLPEAFLFRDSLSATEYQISGLCQSCQRKVFDYV
jgi:hypothetical protein